MIILLPCALLRGSDGHFPRARAPATLPALTARRWLRSRTGRASPSSTLAAPYRRARGGAIACGHTGGSPLRGPPLGRATPSASRPYTCSRGARRRSSRGRSPGQNPRLERRGRGSRAQRLGRGLAEFLQLFLRDEPVHAPVPTSFPLLIEMNLAEHVASQDRHARALRTQAVPPSTSPTFRWIDRVRREATPLLGVRKRRPRARLHSSRRLVRGRVASARDSVGIDVVVTVARSALNWRRPTALPALARRRLRRPRSGRGRASARVPAARPTPLARWLAPRRLLPGGRTRRRRRRGRGTGGSTAAAAAARRRPRRAPACMPERRTRRSRRRARGSGTSTAACAPRRPRRRAAAASGSRTRPAHIRKHIGAHAHAAVLGKLLPSLEPDSPVVEYRVFVHAHSCARSIVAARRTFAMMHNDPREIVRALAIHRPKNLRKAHSPSVVPLAPIIEVDHPLHMHEEHRRRPLPAIACIYPDARTDPRPGRFSLSRTEVSVRRTPLAWLSNMP